MMLAKVKAFAKLALRAIIALLVLLILLYAAFKAWEYRTIENKQSEKSAMQREQKIKYEDFTKDQALYVPLMVGTSSLDYVQHGSRNFIFTYLLSVDYKAFLEAMEDSAQMIYVGSQILGSGCKKQACNELEAAFVVDIESNQYFAAISQKGKIAYYGIEEGKPIPQAFMKWHLHEAVEGMK